MSAFICSHAHINAIVRWASVNRVTAQYENPTRTWPIKGYEQETAECLLAENTISFNHRYAESLLPDEILYNGKGRAGLQPIEAIKAAQCLAYQSCEHPGWESSAAKAICAAVIEHATRKLPGYEEAEWSID